MHLDFGRKQVVHDGKADVLLIALVAVHPEKFWQQRPGILKQKNMTHNITISVAEPEPPEPGLFFLEPFKISRLMTKKCCTARRSRRNFKSQEV